MNDPVSVVVECLRALLYQEVRIIQASHAGHPVWHLFRALKVPIIAKSIKVFMTISLDVYSAA